MAKNREDSLLLERLVRETMIRLRPLVLPRDDERLGPTMVIALITMRDLPPLPTLELAEHLHRDKSQAAKIIRSLERKSLVKIDQSEDDKRVKRASLTKRGYAYSSKLLSVWDEIAEQVLAPLTDDQRRQFYDLLSVIYSQLDN